MRKFLAPVVGALMAVLFTTGAAAASGDEPAGEPPEPPEHHLRPPLVAVAGEEFEEFIDCLREQGVDVPEDVSEWVFPRLRVHGDGEEAKKWRAAVEECRSLLPEDVREEHRRLIPDIPAERLEELRQRGEEFRDCLREQGVDVKVEESEDGRLHRFGFFHDASEEELEAFREAVEACGGTLPHDFDGLPALDGLPARLDA
jgi:hypothetical protein